MQKIKEWSTKAKILGILLLVVYIFVWLITGFVAGKKSAQAADIKSPIGSLINENIVPALADFSNPINGVWFTQAEAKKWKNKVPMAVMIENHVLARPHSGLYLADVVYEALAEGAVTRFMAVFLSQDSKNDLGPVRSARAYYFDWAREYSAAYAYWGGNEFVRAQANKIFGKKNLDQFVIGSPTFFRRPPGGVHQAYTTTTGLWGEANVRGVNKPVKIDSWLFKEDLPVKKAKAANITVGFDGNADYVVVWRYNAKVNAYNRFNAGVAHKDKVFNRQLSAKTIIVQHVKFEGYSEVTPGVSNRVFQTTGTGKVQIFRDGTAVTGTWRKKSKNARTKFFDKKGNEIPLNRGRIWVEIVPSGSSVTFK
ncbi:DUF3048 domain-containing protein [Patescibacteria group bacterium]|nr:DUF3048 domain-containing protein [Patescibacteria group bacterium]